MKGCLSQFVTEIISDSNNTVVLTMDRKYILCDISIMLMACYVGPEGNPLYKSTDHEKDALLSQSEKLFAAQNRK